MRIAEFRFAVSSIRLTRLPLSVPRDEEEPILVRILDGDETPTPAFVRRGRNHYPSRQQIPVIGVNIANANKKVRAPTASQHGFELLRQSELQSSCTQRGSGWLGIKIGALELETKLPAIEVDRFFQIINLEKQEIHPGEHSFASYAVNSK